MNAIITALICLTLVGLFAALVFTAAEAFVSWKERKHE